MKLWFQTYFQNDIDFLSTNNPNQAGGGAKMSHGNQGYYHFSHSELEVAPRWKKIIIDMLCYTFSDCVGYPALEMLKIKISHWRNKKITFFQVEPNWLQYCWGWEIKITSKMFKMVAVYLQNGQQSLERDLIMGNWALQSTFEK